MAEEVTYREAVKRAIDKALDEDERVFVMGEDVGRYGGTYAVTHGLLEKYGPDRVRDTPLAESGFVGAGIGAAIGGMRPIVEVMTVNFSLLALDQIVNNAATLCHMSAGQFNVPLVIRMSTGAGRQLAAQHSHSWEGWYAHIPGVKILAPATVTDAYGMLLSALEEPDPTLIFEHALLYNMKGLLDTDDFGNFNIKSANVAKEGKDLTILTYGGSLPKVIESANDLDAEGVSAEVIDLRVLRPLDDETILASVRKTSKVLIVDEGWKSGSLSAELCTRIVEHAFFDLDAPIARVCSEEVPIPYAKHLEEAALPQVEKIVAKAKELVGSK
ncbi:MAG: alpha-ketoacid dehydrogenase subunit beta [Bdellovibrionota bacterium]